MDWTQVEQRLVEDDRNKWDRKALATTLTADDGSCTPSAEPVRNGDAR
jgi:hypothetical protein